jgi:thiopurine S-methyltransferase
MYQGDFFAMNDIPALKNFDFIWDRAAMVAINPPDREKYAKKIKSLLVPSGTILLDALVREEGKTGPPHTLTETHIRDAYKPIGFEVNHLEHNEDLSSIDRLGAIQIHTYYIKIM